MTDCENTFTDELDSLILNECSNDGNDDHPRYLWTVDIAFASCIYRKRKEKKKYVE